MNSVRQNMRSDTGNSFQMLGTMVGLGILCALLIVLTYQGTMPAIEKNKAEALEKAIYRVVPGISTKIAYSFDRENGFIFSESESDNPLVFAGFDELGNLVGFAIEATGMGFADQLKILYGYNPNEQKIIGFYVLESKETPGLGDKIEKDTSFLSNFKALDVRLDASGETLINQIRTVKQGKKVNAWEIDGITGATISSRAIGDILASSTNNWIPVIQESLPLFENVEHLKDLEYE